MDEERGFDQSVPDDVHIGDKRELPAHQERAAESLSDRDRRVNTVAGWSAYVDLATKVLVVGSCVLAFWWTSAFDKVLKLLDTFGQGGWNAGIAVAVAIVGSRFASVLLKSR